MPKRVLVLSASVGGGHIRAAQAVEAALRELDPTAIVENIDVLKLTNGIFRRFYAQGYIDLVNKAPYLFGYLYELTDRPPRPETLRNKLRVWMQDLHTKRLRELILKQSYDVIVSTHFLPPEIIAALRQAGRIQTPHISVITDFDVHGMWIHQPCELFTTATEEGKAHLEALGIAPEKIRVTGIPIHPAFSRAYDRPALLAKYGIAGDRPVLLQLAGGFGVGPIEELFQAVLNIPAPLDVIVVAGRNESARQRLERIAVPPHHRAKIIGFTSDMHELMNIADLILSKPGGLTTSEALACGVGMAIVNPIPGQESRNADYLLEMGAGVKINNVTTLGYKLTPLLSDRSRLEALKTAAKRLGHPRAAFDAATEALALAGR